MSKTKDTAADEKATSMDVDPVQAKYEAEALAEQAAIDAKKAKKEVKAEPAADAVEPYEGMPARFDTGGATAEEKAAWIEAHGGPKVEGVVEPGHAEPKAEGDVPPQ